MNGVSMRTAVAGTRILNDDMQSEAAIANDQDSLEMVRCLLCLVDCGFQGRGAVTLVSKWLYADNYEFFNLYGFHSYCVSH